jgi:HEAT repeat protein
VVRFGAMAAVATIDRLEALRYLPALSAELERAPADRENLRDRESRLVSTARALGALGPDARSALPALIRTWERHRGMEREDLGIAIVRIDAQAGAPVIREILDALEHADPFFQPDALRALQGMGPAAATAIPAVTRLLDSPDEAIRLAATAALAAIRVPSAR